MRCQQQQPPRSLQPPLSAISDMRALEGRMVPNARFSLGGQPRPQLWDAMMRGLMSAEAPRSNQPAPRSQQQQRQQDEEEDDSGHESTAVVKRSKTNSERGRAFRARRKKYEDDLVMIVSSLRQEVADLGFLRSVRADKVLRSRNSMGGSLVRLAREYFALFERGMPTVRGAGHKRPALLTDGSEDDGQEPLEAKQQRFIECAMDPELQFGEACGPQALLDQWKRYSSYHSSMHVEVVGIEVSGEEDNPMVTVRSDLHVVFSRATFDHVFPHVAHNEELVQRFIGREVVYHGVNRFQFSPKGQILIYDSDVGFVDALVQAGASVSDIALLMQQARIADECRLGEEGRNNSKNDSRVQELEPDNQDSSENDSNSGSDFAFVVDSDDVTSLPQIAEACPEAARSTERSRLAIDFLLS